MLTFGSRCSSGSRSRPRPSSEHGLDTALGHADPRGDEPVAEPALVEPLDFRHNKRREHGVRVLGAAVVPPVPHGHLWHHTDVPLCRMDAPPVQYRTAFTGSGPLTSLLLRASSTSSSGFPRTGASSYDPPRAPSTYHPGGVSQRWARAHRHHIARITTAARGVNDRLRISTSREARIQCRRRRAPGTQPAP